MRSLAWEIGCISVNANGASSSCCWAALQARVRWRRALSVVIIPVLTQHYAMLQRNLLYTGVTRGKRLVVLVGQKKAVATAVRNVSGRRRWSKLGEWLRPGMLAFLSPRGGSLKHSRRDPDIPGIVRADLRNPHSNSPFVAASFPKLEW
jgi:hypothetical protein